MSAAHIYGEVLEVTAEADVLACHTLMQQLRPQLLTSEEWLARFTRQAAQGYRLLALWHARRPVALGGFRLQENLVHGRFLYVDDLVTDANDRSGGRGTWMMDALKAEASRCGCDLLVLDTGLANVQAHRFYYRNGLLARALRFSMPVEEKS
ncbi:MAG: putative acetyltransferase [Rhodoferax sp.]|nr:putative acetyltransferase [Rhodoferax sp.]